MKSFALSAAVAVAMCSALALSGCGSSSTPSGSAPVASPTVSSLSPSNAIVGSASETLTVTGANFVPGTEITWQGNERATLYVSPTSLQTTLSIADLASVATAQVAAKNPDDLGGATSSALPFVIAANSTPNPVPDLISITPDSAQAGASQTSISLSGSNFVPSSVVLLNGSTPLSSAYQSTSSLTAIIPASSLLSAATLTISVSNPSPGGGSSAGVSFTVSNAATQGTAMVNVAANDLAWDPVNQVIYLSLPSADGSNGNSIQTLNPFKATLGGSVFAGSEPNLLAVSKSSKYLYAALDGSSSVQRFVRPALTPDIDISFGSASFYGAYVAMDLQTSPVADGTVSFVLGALDVSPEEEGGVHIFDDAVERPDYLCGFIQINCTGNVNTGGNLFDSIQWSPAADAMYMLNNEDTGFDFYTAPVTPTGFGNVTDFGGLAGGFGDMLHYDATTKLLYTDYGVVIDPVTGLKAGEIDASGLAETDGEAGLIFYLGQTEADFGSTTYTLESFDINHLTPIATLTVTSVNGEPTHLIRWGTNGLAFTTETSIFNGSPGAVYLISGSFVTTAVKSASLPVTNVRRFRNARNHSSVVSSAAVGNRKP